jgi:hypothetical protein
MPESNTAIIAAVVAGTLAILAVLIPGIVSIIRALRETKASQTHISEEQDSSKLRGLKRDRKIQEIHLLVNSRLVTVLRLLVAVTKKEADRTADPSAISAYKEALAELTRAEASTQGVISEGAMSRDVDISEEVLKRVDKLDKTS